MFSIFRKKITLAQVSDLLVLVACQIVDEDIYKKINLFTKQHPDFECFHDKLKSHALIITILNGLIAIITRERSWEIGYTLIEDYICSSIMKQKKYEDVNKIKGQVDERLKAYCMRLNKSVIVTKHLNKKFGWEKCIKSSLDEVIAELAEYITDNVRSTTYETPYHLTKSDGTEQDIFQHAFLVLENDEYVVHENLKGIFPLKQRDKEHDELEFFLGELVEFIPTYLDVFRNYKFVA